MPPVPSLIWLPTRKGGSPSSAAAVGGEGLVVIAVGGWVGWGGLGWEVSRMRWEGVGWRGFVWQGKGPALGAAAAHGDERHADSCVGRCLWLGGWVDVVWCGVVGWVEEWVGRSSLEVHRMGGPEGEASSSS